DLIGGNLSRTLHMHELLLGSLCGASAYGSGGPIGRELSALSTLSALNLKSWQFASDGLLTLAECAFDGSTATEAVPPNLWLPISTDLEHLDPIGTFQVGNVSSRFAILEANHLDLAGRNWEMESSNDIWRWYASRVLDLL